MKTQHTPGPWKVSEIINAILPGQGNDLASFYEVETNEAMFAGGGIALVTAKAGKQGEANARLIAAAPSLLSQLRNIEDLAAKSAEHGSANWCAVRDLARAAIAKAEAQA